MLMFTEPFVIKALLAGITMAVLSGPLGSVMLWRSMSYFGDAMSHTAMLGVALGLLLGIETSIGIFAIVLLCAGIFFFLHEKKFAHSDTLLCIIAQIGLSAGIIFLAISKMKSSNITAFLFGDILSISNFDLIYICIVGGIVSLLLIFNWQNLIFLSFDEETAEAEGQNTFLTKFIFMLIIALFVSLAIKTIGLLLVTALLIIPSSIARHFAKSPEQMAFLSSLIGLFSVFFGMFFSFYFDIPTGPAIVISAGTFALFSFLFKKR